jgi:putative membrane protein insertion efficiency factor
VAFPELFVHLPRRALMLLVRGYRLLLSPWLGSACRFEPTCSAYSLQALEQHGAVLGVLLTAGRLARCHPWCAGGHDPVPAEPLRLFTRLIHGAPRCAASPESLPLSREKNIP